MDFKNCSFTAVFVYYKKVSETTWYPYRDFYRETRAKKQDLDTITAQQVSYRIKTKIEQVLRKERGILARRKRTLNDNTSL